MPILGTVASSFVSGAPGLYDSIATITMTADATSVTFSSIPATYTHLELRFITKSPPQYSYDIFGQFNNDTGSNYNSARLYGSPGGVYFDGTSATEAQIFMFGRTAENNSTDLSPNIVTILDYANTNKYKTTRITYGVNDFSGTGGLTAMNTGVWRSTSAIDSIKMTLYLGGNLDAPSTFALYGIKTA